MPQELAGLLCGLTAATFQSLSYLFSRRFLSRGCGGPVELFAVSQMQLGILSLAALPFFLRHLPVDWAPFILSALGTSLSYLLGQFFLFQALRTVESSQFAPLLGFKIPILALATALVLGHPIPVLAWLAIALCLTAGLLIAPPGRLGSGRALSLAAGCAIGYAGSDFSIPFLVKACGGMGPHPVLLAVTTCYLVAGAVGTGLILTGRLGPRRAFLAPAIQADAFPYSLAWLLAMVFLFACFHFIGVVLGNMVQSSRSLISVVLAAAITHLGWLHLEDVRKGVWLRRLGGAGLMTASIALYFWATGGR